MPTPDHFFCSIQDQDNDSRLVQSSESRVAMRRDIEPNREDCHNVHEVSIDRERKMKFSLSFTINILPKDWGIVFSSPLSLYSKDRFVSFPRYTSHEYRIHEIYYKRSNGKHKVWQVEGRRLTCVHTVVYRFPQLKLPRCLGQ